MKGRRRKEGRRAGKGDMKGKRGRGKAYRRGPRREIRKNAREMQPQNTLEKKDKTQRKERKDQEDPNVLQRNS